MAEKKLTKLEDLARQRIVSWLAAHPEITQAKLAEEVGKSQTWVSQYKSGDQGADIDQLAAMARVFGHTLMELIDLQQDPAERDLLDAFRAIPSGSRGTALQSVRIMAGLLGPPPSQKRKP